jgi:hypothetical protein
MPLWTDIECIRAMLNRASGCPSIYFGIDPAKLESDRTVTYVRLPADFKVTDTNRLHIYEEGDKMALDCVAACLAQPPSCNIADAAFGTKGESKPEAPPFDTDRAWDMVVLAARTSRYSED